MVSVGKGSPYERVFENTDSVTGLGADAFWADAALALGRAESAASLRRLFYGLECAFLAYGLAACSVGLLKSVNLYVAFSTGLPSIVAKCEYLVEGPSRMAAVFFLFQSGLTQVFHGLCFVLARSSAVAFLAAVSAWLVFTAAYFLDFLSLSPLTGAYSTLLRAQHREARLLFEQRAAAAHANKARDPR